MVVCVVCDCERMRDRRDEVCDDVVVEVAVVMGMWLVLLLMMRIEIGRVKSDTSVLRMH